MEVEHIVLQPGHFVAVFCENSATEPEIACCTKVNESEAQIVWYKGTYTSQWKPWRIRDPKNQRKFIEWTDTISMSSIILYAFQLTPKLHLKKTTAERLKSDYAKLKGMIDT